MPAMDHPGTSLNVPSCLPSTWAPEPGHTWIYEQWLESIKASDPERYVRLLHFTRAMYNVLYRDGLLLRGGQPTNSAFPMRNYDGDHEYRNKDGEDNVDEYEGMSGSESKSEDESECEGEGESVSEDVSDEDCKGHSISDDNGDGSISESNNDDDSENCIDSDYCSDNSDSDAWDSEYDELGRRYS